MATVPSVVQIWGSTSNTSVAENPLSVPVAVIAWSPFCTPSMSTRVEKLPSAPAGTVTITTPSRWTVIGSPGVNPEPDAVT